MGERLKQGQLSLWFEGALRGNEKARERIHEYLLPRLSTRLQDTPDQPDKIIQATMSVIDSSLHPLYLLYLEHKRNLSNVLIEHGLSFMHQIMSRRSREKFRNQITDFIPNYEEQLPYLLSSLPDSQRDVLEFMLFHNKNISQAAEELEMSQAAVRQRLHRGRLIIEPDLMHPFGIRRVTQLRDKRLQDAAYDGYLESFKFLDLFYTDETAVSRYHSPNHGSLYTPWKRLWRAEETRSWI